MVNNAQADIEITLRLKAQQIQNDMNDIKKRLKSNFSDFEALNLIQTQKGMKNVNRELRMITDSGKAASRQIKFQRDFFQDINTVLGKVDKNIDKQKKQFPSWALSIMFAGMALQRMSVSLMTFGTKAYDEVSHSIIGTITANDRLQGSMLYLGYTMGEAFAPVLEYLIPIITGISEWVSENDSLVRTVTMIGVIFGTMMLATGGLTLAINGLKTFKNLITETNWTSFGNQIQSAVGMIAIGYSLVAAEGAYSDFKSGKAMAGIKDALTSAAMMVGGFVMMSNPIVGGALIGVGLTFKFMNDKFFAQFVTVLQTMANILLLLGAVIIDTLVSPFIAAYNVVVATRNLLSKKDDWKPMEQYSLTSKSYDKMMSDASNYWNINADGTKGSNTTNANTTNNYYGTVNQGVSSKDNLTSSAFGQQVSSYGTPVW
jgi:hypothetical protein